MGIEKKVSCFCGGVMSSKLHGVGFRKEGSTGRFRKTAGRVTKMP